MTRSRLAAFLLALSVSTSALGFGWLEDAVNLVLGKSDTIWLVVLEHNWERSLQEKQYSEGEMLKAFFARSKHVEVRHRFFTDAASLRKWCGEIEKIPGPVYVLFSDHGSPDGLYAEEDDIGYNAIADSLLNAENVKLIHLAACSVMRGSFAGNLSGRLGKEQSPPISGFSTNVDWSLSSIADFLYFDLILNDGLAPADAALQLRIMMPIIGRYPVVGCNYEPLGFTILEPRRYWNPSPLKCGH